MEKRPRENQGEKNSIYKSVGILVRPLWCAAAPGLLRARQSGSRPGQPALHNWAFRRPLLLPDPRVIEYSDDVVFLFHPPHLLYHLPAPLPDHSSIVVLVVGVWIVLFV